MKLNVRGLFDGKLSELSVMETDGNGISVSFRFRQARFPFAMSGPTHRHTEVEQQFPVGGGQHLHT